MCWPFACFIPFQDEVKDSRDGQSKTSLTEFLLVGVGTFFGLLTAGIVYRQWKRNRKHRKRKCWVYLFPCTVGVLLSYLNFVWDCLCVDVVSTQTKTSQVWPKSQKMGEDMNNNITAHGAHYLIGRSAFQDVFYQAIKTCFIRLLSSVMMTKVRKNKSCRK